MADEPGIAKPLSRRQELRETCIQIAGARLKVDPDVASMISHRLTDKKGDDPAEWPESLRVREYPEVRS